MWYLKDSSPPIHSPIAIPLYSWPQKTRRSQDAHLLYRGDPGGPCWNRLLNLQRVLDLHGSHPSALRTADPLRLQPRRTRGVGRRLRSDPVRRPQWRGQMCHQHVRTGNPSRHHVANPHGSAANGLPAVPVAFSGDTTFAIAVLTRQVFSDVSGEYKDFGANGTVLITTDVVCLTRVGSARFPFLLFSSPLPDHLEFRLCASRSTDDALDLGSPQHHPDPGHFPGLCVCGLHRYLPDLRRASFRLNPDRGLGTLRRFPQSRNPGADKTAGRHWDLSACRKFQIGSGLRMAMRLSRCCVYPPDVRTLFFVYQTKSIAIFTM